MGFEQALELARGGFWMALTIAAPILIVGLLVGLSVALFQAVTQLQEQSLTFAPKIAAMIVAAAIFMPWISERMLEYARTMFTTLPWQ